MPHPTPTPPPRQRLRARGSAENPDGRFERLSYAEDPDFIELRVAEGDAPTLRTRLYEDRSRTLLAKNDSPDVPFDVSLNPYRGCEHGCIYCYARPTHEYLGFSAGLDFESKLLVKRNAAELLRKTLASPRWRPQTIAMGGVTDVYQPVERRLGITRRCLEVFAAFRHPVAIVTKSTLVERDIDLLGELAQHGAGAVFLSVTSLDDDLARVLEPRAAPPRRRLAVIEALRRAGVPVGAMVAPVIPALTDHEIPAIVQAVADAGAVAVRHLMLRLPHGLGPLFDAWLERHYPERKEKVLSRVRAMRGGRLNDARFHTRMRGSGVHAEQTHALFDLACRRAGISQEGPELSTAAFRRPSDGQLSLF